jgi:hypothetical protein
MDSELSFVESHADGLPDVLAKLEQVDRLHRYDIMRLSGGSVAWVAHPAVCGRMALDPRPGCGVCLVAKGG